MTNANVGFPPPLDERAAAEAVNFNLKTFRNLRYAGRGPKYIQEGRLIRYRPEALAKWLQEEER